MEPIFKSCNDKLSEAFESIKKRIVTRSPVNAVIVARDDMNKLSALIQDFKTTVSGLSVLIHSLGLELENVTENAIREKVTNMKSIHIEQLSKFFYPISSIQEYELNKEKEQAINKNLNEIESLESKINELFRQLSEIEKSAESFISSDKNV